MTGNSSSKRPATADLRRRFDELEQRHAEIAAVRDEEQQILKLILDGIREGVVVADEHGRFLHFNQFATEILGIGSVDAGPEHWPKEYGVYLPDKVTPCPKDELPLLRAIRGEEVIGVNLFIRNPHRPKGIWIVCSARPMLGPDGRSRGGVLAFRDVTVEREAQREISARDEGLRRLTSELIIAEDRERKRLAGDLHDGLGQMLALVQLKLSELRGQECVASENLEEIMQLVRETHESVRSLTFRISPPILHELGIGAAIQWLIDDLKERVRLDTRFSSRGQVSRLGERERILLYRSVRELLLNIHKHARGASARVSLLWTPAALRIVIEDDGPGFDPVEELRSHMDGFGLFSIRERLRHLGGRTEIDSKPGRGCRVTIDMPIAIAEEGDPDLDDRPLA